MPATQQPSVMLGTDPGKKVPQYGIYARTLDRNRTVGFNLNDPQCVSLFGQMGAGKSYSLGTLLEMASVQHDSLNLLPSPLCSVVYHFSEEKSHKPEFATMVAPNKNQKEVDLLASLYGAQPMACSDVVMLAPKSSVEERKREYGPMGIEVGSMCFHPSELEGNHWKYLMGAVGDAELYLKVLKSEIGDLAQAGNLTIQSIEQAIGGSYLEPQEQRRCHLRMRMAKRFIDEKGPGVGSWVRPGRVILVDARDDFIEKEEIFSILLVMMQVLSSATYGGNPVNKLVVFDEAHQYLTNKDLIDGMIGLVRVMRHRRTSICFASQDPISIPQRVIELSTQLIMHRMVSAAWLAHIAAVNTAVAKLRPSDLAFLGRGEAQIWSQTCDDPVFTEQCYKCSVRPRFSQHGGFTKSATGA